jgi:hypothetical protein
LRSGLPENRDKIRSDTAWGLGMSRADGIKGVVLELARAAAPETAAPEEQLDLLSLPAGHAVSRFDAKAVEQVAERERAGGRPKGAKNLVTRELREMMLRSGTNPLLAMMRWGSLSPEELANRLGIKPAEAFDKLVGLWRETAPYLMGKAVATDDHGNAMPTIQLNIGGRAVSIGPDARPPWEELNEPGIIEHNQQLSVDDDGDDDAMSHESMSHE